MKTSEKTHLPVLPPQQPLDDFRACLEVILLWVRGGRHGIVDVPSCLDTIEQTAGELHTLLSVIPELDGEAERGDSTGRLSRGTAP